MKTKDKFYIKLRSQLMRILYAVDSFFGLNKDKVTIFCYHSISKKRDKYSVDFHLFKKEIEKTLKYAKFIRIEDAVKAKIIGQSVVLTVDDGYEDVMKILPITQKYKIPVTLFVLSDPKNANRYELSHNGKFLNTKQIKYLMSKGWSIGGHSATHVNFSKLTPREIEKEIVESKKVLEQKLGARINYFSYPKGVCDKKIVQAVKKAGYKAAFSVAPSHKDEKSDLLAFPRVVIDSSFTVFDFPALYSSSTFRLRRLMGNLL